MSVIIMIVEDHEHVRSALSDWFNLALGDCEIIEAASGEEAIDMASQFHPQLIIMDLDLPQMSGVKATQQIKTILPGTSIIILTIYEDDVYRHDAFSSGAAAFVPKRKMQTELLPTVTALLSQQLQTDSVSVSGFGSNNNGQKV
jgi:DNA-binding NarL/FixJ family response regulator